jgi:capsular polysaccharide biosynthesis protein
LTIGDLTLSPEFDSETLAYTVTTTDNTNKVTATTDDPSAVIEIVLTNSEEEDGVAVANGAYATWASGENTLTITVTDGASETVYVVTVTKEVVDSSLSALTIGALTLSPEFDSETLAYTVTTTDAANKVTATTDDPSAVIEIVLTNSEEEEGVAVANGTAVTWASGENVLTITVTDGDSETVYVVTVTKEEQGE